MSFRTTLYDNTTLPTELIELVMDGVEQKKSHWENVIKNVNSEFIAHPVKTPSQITTYLRFLKNLQDEYDYEHDYE